MSPSSLLRATGVSSLATLVSRVAGVLREVVFAAWFGAGAEVDAFQNAIVVPGALRRFVADEGLTGAVIPEVARARREGGEERARQVIAGSLAVLLASLAVVVGIGIALAPWWVLLFDSSLPGKPEEWAFTSRLARWLLPFVAFVSVVSWCEGLLNLRGHFFVPKVAPGLVGVSVALCIVLFGDGFGMDAVVLGMLIGGAVQLAACLVALHGHEGAVWPDPAGWRDPRVQAMASSMLKVALVGVAAQLHVLVLRQITNALEVGATSHFAYAQRVVALPQGLAAVAVAAAVLPVVVRGAQSGDHAAVRDALAGAVRLAALAAVPAAVMMAVLAEPVVDLLFHRGAFGLDDLESTAAVVRWLAPFLVPAAVLLLMRKVFYAVDDRATLVAIGVIGAVGTALFGVLLVPLMGLPGLGLALAASTTIQVGVCIWRLRRHLSGRVGLWRTVDPLARILVASLVAAALPAWLASSWSAELGLAGSAALLVVAGSAGVVVYVVGVRAAGIPEVEGVEAAIRRRVGRSTPPPAA